MTIKSLYCAMLLTCTNVSFENVCILRTNMAFLQASLLPHIFLFVWARFLFRKFCFGLKNPWNQSIPSKSIHKCLMTVVVFYVLAEINKTTIRYKIKCLHNRNNAKCVMLPRNYVRYMHTLRPMSSSHTVCVLMRRASGLHWAALWGAAGKVSLFTLSIWRKATGCGCLMVCRRP